MNRALYAPLPPELERGDVDTRSINAFRHGFPSPLVRWHFHDEYELHLIVASEGEFFIGDHIGSFAPGHLVLTGPYLPHNWISRNHPGDAVARRDCVVQFRKRLIQLLATGAPELAELLPLLERARHGIEFNDAARLDAERWFDDIIDAEGSARIGLLIEFLGRLAHEPYCRQLSTAVHDELVNTAPLEKLEKVISHISANHTDPLSITSVASLVGMSNSSFSRFFSKMAGCSYTAFLNRVRIAHACELLGSPDQSVTEVCFAVGFNNAANFNRRFRELKGLTPREYRLLAQRGHAPVFDDELRAAPSGD